MGTDREALPDPYGYVPSPASNGNRDAVAVEVVKGEPPTPTEPGWLDDTRPSHWYVLTAHPDGVGQVLASARLAQQRTGTTQIVHHHRCGEDCVESCGPPPDPKPDEEAAPS